MIYNNPQILIREISVMKQRYIIHDTDDVMCLKIYSWKNKQNNINILSYLEMREIK